PQGNPADTVSKAALRVLTAQLAHALRQSVAPISAHLFVPSTCTALVARRVPGKPAAALTSAQTIDPFIGRMGRGDGYPLCPDNDVGETRDRRRTERSAGDVIENRPALPLWHPGFAETFAAFARPGR
ncbi:MAG: short-chain dehydrogenase, partial [Pseudomonadota bacterium]